MRFRDRRQAGERLAVALERFRDDRPVVLALPRGGVPVAAEIAAALGAPLDLVLVRKIGLPDDPELAMGAVVDGAAPIVVKNDDIVAAAHIDTATFATVEARELAEIERRRQRWLGTRPPARVTGRTVIVVDDGIATGATVRAALRAIRRRGPARLVLAVPVAAPDALAALRPLADDVVCLLAPSPFGAVGRFYDDFRPTGEDEVAAGLARCPIAAADAESPQTFGA